MQRNLTWSLLATALCLFALIYFFERKIPSAKERRQPKRVLPMASADEIKGIDVMLPDQGVVRAEKTNGAWLLSAPRYPARQIALEMFATNLVELRAFDRISAREANLQGQKSFGLA